MPNRLSHETSPYLLQHRDNPVDWYPWGEEAFVAARERDVPVLLSVGYSSCHWCHVMAHESFESGETAALMNQWFVNVKVDREERPDIDGVYMTAVQAMTGQGGWPMTVFMTPDGRPFYAGTYFPPADGHGRPGFPRVLEALHEAWTTEREKILAQAEGVTDHIRALANRAPEPSMLAYDLPDHGVAGFRDVFDETWGGFGSAPKFPSPGNLEFLLAHHARRGPVGDPPALNMALTTLVRMAQGGVYDHLGGGFARYSVDRHWLVPHFEKMLYDNAQLARVYLHAFQLTGEPFFERIVRETLGYLLRDMRHSSGGFFAAEDADSEGIEGKFYVWTPAEVEAVLGEEDAHLFCAYYGVKEGGNFQDPHHPEFGRRTVLASWDAPEALGPRLGIAPDALVERVLAMRPRMLAARNQRIRPGLDDKVLASWNGLALAAFAEAGRVLRDPEFLDAALGLAAFVRRDLWRDGRLLHTWKDGVAKVEGMLDDYAFWGLGLVELFKATGDLAHLDWAKECFELLLREFHDEVTGTFFETATGSERLIARQRSFFDDATPSGNGAVAQLAWWLGRYYGKTEWEEVASRILASVAEFLEKAPTGFGSSWQALELSLAPRQELAIVGSPGARAPLEAAAAGSYRPWLIVAPSATGAGLPLFEGREVGEGPFAYLCQDFSCQLPAATPEALREQLAHLS